MTHSPMTIQSLTWIALALMTPIKVLAIGTTQTWSSDVTHYTFDKGIWDMGAAWTGIVTMAHEVESIKSQASFAQTFGSSHFLAQVTFWQQQKASCLWAVKPLTEAQKSRRGWLSTKGYCLQEANCLQEADCLPETNCLIAASCVCVCVCVSVCVCVCVVCLCVGVSQVLASALWPTLFS